MVVVLNIVPPDLNFEASFLFQKLNFHFLRIHARVARWFIFEPKIPIWVNFGGPWIGKR
jgi:hypothetical protein